MGIKVLGFSFISVSSSLASGRESLGSGCIITDKCRGAKKRCKKNDGCEYIKASEIESKGVKLAINRAEDADLNILLLDPKNLDFKGFFKDQISEKSIIAINKSDLGTVNIKNINKKIDPIIMSIKESNNVDKLIEAIKSKLKKQFLKTDNVLITRSRHRQHLKECLKHLNSFLEKKKNEEFDKAAEDLRMSIRHLGTIVGRVDVEEILGSIFDNFCIGK